MNDPGQMPQCTDEWAQNKWFFQLCHPWPCDSACPFQIVFSLGWALMLQCSYKSFGSLGS